MKKVLAVFVVFIALASSAWAEIRIDADFPGGNIVVEKIEGDTVSLRTDLRDTKGWWFYWNFRVRGAAGRTVTFQFIENAPIGVRGPAFSLDDGVSWKWMGTPGSTKAFKFSFPADAHAVRFAFAIPYTQQNLDAFLKTIGRNSALRKETLCSSRKGRGVERLHVGKVKGEPKYRVFITCRAHACEMMTSYVVEGLIQSLLADDTDGKWFRKNVELLIIPFVDKDGVEDGDQGKNRDPRDHNRDYDENSLYPETRAMQEFVPRWSGGKLCLAIDLHCPAIRGEYNEVIYIVGSQKPEIWTEQQRFGAMLEKCNKGPLVYRAADNLPYGQKWNTGANFTLGPSGSRWASSIPGVKLATTIEFPYANVAGGEVNAETARLFGKDLAAAIKGYLETR